MSILEHLNNNGEIVVILIACLIVAVLAATGTLEAHIEEVEQSRAESLTLSELDIDKVKEVNKYMRLPL